MRPTPIRGSNYRNETVIMDGGLNENVSSIELRGGELISSLNYELVEGAGGGYRSISGYERFDGQTKPSSIAAIPTDHAAQDAARLLIGAVPGDGNILGVHIFKEKVYAFRNKIGGATAGMYVSSASGWVEVDTSANPLAPDGEYSFVNYNYLSTASSFSMYWVDGVNKARSYDGTTVTVIDNSGMDPEDKPINIAAHNNRLFLAYRLGSLQYSSLGDPTDWTTGAGEIGIGKEITDLQSGVGNALIIFCDEAIRVLDGQTPPDWRLDSHSESSGAYPQTAKRMLGTIFFMDDRGVSTLSAVQEFGDFASNSISQRVKKTLLSVKENITAATVSRDLNQYRLYTSDGSGMVFSFLNKKLRGVTIIKYNNPVLVIAEGEIGTDNVIFFGSSDGYVYQMDSGTSFDGAEIPTIMSTSYYHYRSPRNWKRFSKITFEIAAETSMDFFVKADFDYRKPTHPQGVEGAFTVSGVGAYWGSGVWGVMRWSGSQTTNRVHYYQLGLGANMSITLKTSETYSGQHIVQNMITDLTLLGRQM